MTIPQQTRCRTLLSLLILITCAESLWAQSQSTGLQNPTSLAMDPTTAHAFIVEQDTDKLVRWDGKKTDTLFDELSKEPVHIKEIVGSTFRYGNRLTLVGTSTTSPDETKPIRLATLKVDVEDPTKFDLGLSRDLSLEDADSVTAIASTDFAIYLATTSKMTNKVWRIPARKTTLGKASQIFESTSGEISALAVSPQGHLVAAIATPTKESDPDSETACELQFLHAETGKKLLTVPTDVSDVTSLSYSPKSGLLFAAASKAERQGVYRCDVFFDGRQQSVRAFEVAPIDNVMRFVLSTQNAVALVRGKTDGRAVQIEVK